MKLLTLGLMFGAALFGQDARLITLIQEREARALRVQERITYQLSRAAVVQAPSPVPSSPAELSAEDRKALKEAMERVAHCPTEMLIRDCGFYFPDVNEKFLSRR